MQTTNNSKDILVYGDFSPGSIRMARSYKRAFEQLGHTVVTVDTMEAKYHVRPWLLVPYLNRLAARSYFLRRVGSTKWNQRLLDIVRKNRPDVVFIINGDLVMPQTVRDIRREDVRVAIFNVDNPYPPYPRDRPASFKRQYLQAAREAHCYFIWSRNLVERLEDDGVRSDYLPFAWDPEVFPHHGQPGRGNYDYDVVFVGNWDPFRETYLEPVARHFDVTIWGRSHWRTPSSAVWEAWEGEQLGRPEAAEVQARAKICLNILRRHNLPDGTNMRTFETPGSGGFLLSKRTPGAREIFPENVSGAYFDDVPSLLAQVDRFLSHRDTAIDIADRAHATTRENHRYVDRARTVLAHL